MNAAYSPVDGDFSAHQGPAQNPYHRIRVTSSSVGGGFDTSEMKGGATFMLFHCAITDSWNQSFCNVFVTMKIHPFLNNQRFSPIRPLLKKITA